ncbi:MAG: hypothetical protein ACLGIC_13350 [Acidimicrobiia bacterium]
MPDAPSLVTVEPVESRSQLRRFADVPFVLLGHDGRWARGVRAWEQWRLGARRHPYFERGDAAFLLARRAGQPVGRIAAHVEGTGVGAGWFGLFDAADDAEVVDALLAAASAWLAEQEAMTMVGPVTWAIDEEAGVLVDGYDHPAATGRPWHPPWYADQLRRAGGAPDQRIETFRLEVPPDVGEAPSPSGDPRPPVAGGYADPALVLEGIAAVPDVAPLLAGASVRSAWRVARAARERPSDTAVVVRCDGDPAELVPGLLRACAARGYRWLLSPWAPDDRPPERTHQLFRFPLEELAAAPYPST